MKQKGTVECLHCGESFSCSPSQDRKYCSPECYRLAYKSRAEGRTMSGKKRCSKCLTEKSNGDFSPSLRRLDKLSGWCKVCRAALETTRRKTPHVVARFHRRYENDMNFRATQLLCAIGKRCRKKRLPFDLDVDWLQSKLAYGRCELTGIQFNMSVASRRRNPLTPSVDRVIPGLGYTKANCRVVVYALNQAMSDWGLDLIADSLIAARRLERAS